MANWQGISYTGYRDLPRIVYTTDGQRAFVLDCPFDDERDDYCVDYTVHEAPVLPLWNSRRVDWPLPEAASLPLLGRVVLTRDHFDDTRRAALDWDVLAPWL